MQRQVAVEQRLAVLFVHPGLPARRPFLSEVRAVDRVELPVQILIGGDRDAVVAMHKTGARHQRCCVQRRCIENNDDFALAIGRQLGGILLVERVTAAGHFDIELFRRPQRDRFGAARRAVGIERLDDGAPCRSVAVLVDLATA